MIRIRFILLICPQLFLNIYWNGIKIVQYNPLIINHEVKKQNKMIEHAI